MVFYLLSISAELENLTNLQPRGGCDDPSYRYYFKVVLIRIKGFVSDFGFLNQILWCDQVKCENCGEISQKETCVTMSETVPLSSGRATANLVQKVSISNFLCVRLIASSNLSSYQGFYSQLVRIFWFISMSWFLHHVSVMVKFCSIISWRYADFVSELWVYASICLDLLVSC